MSVNDLIATLYVFAAACEIGAATLIGAEIVDNAHDERRIRETLAAMPEIEEERRVLLEITPTSAGDLERMRRVQRAEARAQLATIDRRAARAIWTISLVIGGALAGLGGNLWALYR